MKIINIYPNRGARFGHQMYDICILLCFCNKYNLTYHIDNFDGNCNQFNKLFNLSTIFKCVISNDLTCKQISDFDNYDLLLSYILSNDGFIIKGHICGNEKLIQYIANNYITCMEICKTYDIIGNLFRPSICTIEYNNNMVNIGVHMRRGDIINSNRLIISTTFINIMKLINTCINRVMFHIFSDSPITDIYNEIPNIIDHTNLSETDTLQYMCNMKYLITSKSGFSHIAHIISNNMVYIHDGDWNIYYRQNAYKDINKFIDNINK